MRLFFQYIKQHKNVFIVLTVFFLIFAASFLLYRLPFAAVVYPFFVCFFVGTIFLIIDFIRFRKKHNHLSELKNLSETLLENLRPPENITETDYQTIIKLLCESQKNLETRMNAKYTNMIDYYTVWAHQIKTPIASMRLSLEGEDSYLSRKLSSDLMRIEQYVDMVLTFLRLDSETTDYVITECDLDGIVRSSVKKFAGEFIARKLTIDYSPLNTTVITDEKWLSFVIEQVLSNALKYTRSGSISVYLEKPFTLCIKDTGIGIAAEDLPRIFEKGYTGYNGRSDMKASGIGLYLCRRICSNLGHGISAESTPDSGTTVRICLERPKTKHE